MIKFLVNIMEISFILGVTWKLLRFVVFRKKNRSVRSKGKRIHQKSMIGKIWMLVSRKVHLKLDLMIRKQILDIKEQKKSLAEQDSRDKVGNVVELAGYKSSKGVK